MMVQAPGERLWCSSHCPRTGTVCADHVVSGPFLRCAQKAMRSRQHRTPGPHASVRAAQVHWLCMHRLDGFVSWASAPGALRARWSFGAAHRCWRTGGHRAHLWRSCVDAKVACLPARSVMGLCPHHHCRGASTARAVSTVSPLPAHRQRRVPREPAFVHCAGTVCLAVCCACVRHGDNHQWAGIPWVRRVVHHPLCVVWAMCLACHHTLMHFRPASACVCHTVTPTTFHSGRV